MVTVSGLQLEEIITKGKRNFGVLGNLEPC